MQFLYIINHLKLISMTKITNDFYPTKSKRPYGSLLSLFVVLLMSSQMSWGQQVIGSFPTMDGGFEGQAASGTALIGTAIATGTQRSDWTCGTSSYGTVQSASPRTGLKYISFNLTSTTKRIQSPTAADGAVIGSTSYIVQYYYRTGITAPGGGVQTIGGSSDGTSPTTSVSYTNIGAVGSTTSGSNILTGVIFNTPVIVGASVTGTGIPVSSTILSFTSNTITISNNATATGSNIVLTIPLAATNGIWTKISAKVTAAPSTPTTKYGYFAAFRTASAMSSAMEIDDFVAYAGTVVDVTAPDAPTILSFGTATATQMPISWTAPGTGIDGGGYLVMRYTADPTGQPDPNVNGIYAVGSEIGTGVVAYLGTSPNFTDLGLTPSTTYFYRVYSVDKAFNYSATYSSDSNSTTAPSYATEPTNQASGISFSSVSSTGFTVNFTAGDGSNNLVVIKSGSAVNSDPADGNSYTANTAMGSGSQLGTGNYVVYNGTGNTVTVNGLTKATTYYVKVYSFNGSSGSENYLITNPATGSQLASPGEIISTGLNTAGVTWATGSAWVGGVVPGASDNVTIVAGDKIQVAAAASCYNLTIQPTGKIYNNTALPTNTLQYLTVFGNSLVCDGTLGDKTITDITKDGALGINFNGNLTVSGVGLLRPARIRPNTGTQNATLTVDANMEMTYNGSTGAGGASIYTDNSGNDNITITVNSGKTLSFVSLSNLNTASSSSTNGTANTTINVNGTLTLPAGCYLSMPIAFGKTCALNVNGTLNVDRLNATSSAGGAVPTITVGSSGLISVGNLADFPSATLSAAVTGSGTFTLGSGATINIASPSGLEPVAGPIRTTTRNFSTSANYSYVGTAAQVPGSEFPVTVNNLIVNNAAGVILGADLATNFVTVTVGNLTVPSGKDVTVNNALVNNGTLTIENNANLIQTAVANTNSGTGSALVNRNSNALKRLDYTLWSSPVTGTQTLEGFSPLTSQTPTSRFYIYDYTLGTAGLYASVLPTTLFSAGTGYLIRMPNEDPANLGTGSAYYLGNSTLTYNGIFTGTPNNGTVTLGSITPLASDEYYAVGNPYPSTISANLFLADNATDGTLYFWRKTNTVANSTGSAYATWTTLGAAASNVAPNDIVPNGTIQVGQGFIVKTGPAATTLKFTNAMRTSNNDNQFFKTKQVAQKDRIWLNLTDTNGVFSQALIGYMDGATVGVDNGIDGKYINDSEIALTSNINNEEYTIQGRPAFNASDVVALNFKTDVAGDYTIAIDHADGLFATTQDVYLVDSKTGAETNLKTSSYNFTAASGIDNARFSLKYQKTLKVDASFFNENSVIVYKNNGTLYVNSRAIAIESIQVYDVQGRLIAERKNVKATAAILDNLKANNQVLLVKISGVNNEEVIKKVVN